MRIATEEAACPIEPQPSHHAFDLVHHPREADGVVVRGVNSFSSPSLLTDPGKPDGVVEMQLESAERVFGSLSLDTLYLKRKKPDNPATKSGIVRGSESTD